LKNGAPKTRFHEGVFGKRFENDTGPFKTLAVSHRFGFLRAPFRLLHACDHEVLKHGHLHLRHGRCDGGNLSQDIRTPTLLLNRLLEPSNPIFN